MRVLVLGSGAREHAFAWRLARSPSVREVLVAPGNAGTSTIARNIDLAPDDVPGVVALARREAVDLVVVGPEGPLAAGVVDALAAAGVLAFGPTQAAARLETSKAFAKDFMSRHAIPTAAYASFDDAAEARAWVEARGGAWVVKADGLAAGKGVTVATSVEETLEAIDDALVRRRHGAAGARVVIEERLVGPEVSYHVVCDGSGYVALAAAQDHKRLRDGDRGPNTGGMGAYSPPPMFTAAIEEIVREAIVEPTLRGMRAEGAPFRGALFVGLMLVDGAPRVLEYNTRFGDPETEVLLARWDGDLLPLLLGAARGDLSGVTPRWSAPAALTVVIASEGYPGQTPGGRVIEGLDEAALVDGVTVFHAGTARAGDRVTAEGGRVLAVTATGEDVDAAAARAYEAVDRVRLEGSQHRRDIGAQARRRSPG